MVEGRWNVQASSHLDDHQKEMVLEKLSNRITADGFLLVKSQVERTQLGNKQQVIEKMHQLVVQALHKKKARIATLPSKASKEKRVEQKKAKSEIKTNRRKISQLNLS